MLRCLLHTNVKYVIGLKNLDVGEKCAWRYSWGVKLGMCNLKS